MNPLLEALFEPVDGHYTFIAAVIRELVKHARVGLGEHPAGEFYNHLSCLHPVQYQ